MTARDCWEARDLVALAISKLDLPDTEPVHPGVASHLRGARTQLDAVCALLTFGGTDAP